MNKRIVRVYVEGQGEINFLTQLIYHHFKKVVKVEASGLKANFEDDQLRLVIQVIDSQSGHGGINPKKMQKLFNEIQTNQLIGIETFIILDADTANHKPAGGFLKRKEYLEGYRTKGDFKFFLIPDNNSDGNLETLLNTMISEKGKPFYGCLDSYINCLEQLSTPPPGLVKYDLKKAKFEWYVFNMINKKKSKSTVRNYKEDIWDLDTLGLQPLVGFIKKIFDEQI